MRLKLSDKKSIPPFFVVHHYENVQKWGFRKKVLRKTDGKDIHIFCQSFLKWSQNDTRNHFICKRKENCLWLNFFDLAGNFHIDCEESERILKDVNVLSPPFQRMISIGKNPGLGA